MVKSQNSYGLQLGVYYKDFMELFLLGIATQKCRKLLYTPVFGDDGTTVAL